MKKSRKEQRRLGLRLLGSFSLLCAVGVRAGWFERSKRACEISDDMWAQFPVFWIIAGVYLIYRGINWQSSGHAKTAFYCLNYIPKSERESVVGDLEEEFAQIKKRFGAKRAHLWLWFQVLTSMGPYLVRWLRPLSVRGLLEWIGRRSS